MTDPSDLPEPLVPGQDPQTLHEVWPDSAVVDARIRELRSTVAGAPDQIAELMARGELVDLLRSTGELDDALAQARLAVQRAELVGTPPQQHTATVRLAQVHQRRGEYARADELFAAASAGAGAYGPIIVAYTHQQAGLNDYDQRRWDRAAEHFAAALALRREFELPDDAIRASADALAAAEQRRGGS